MSEYLRILIKALQERVKRLEEARSDVVQFPARKTAFPGIIFRSDNVQLTGLNSQPEATHPYVKFDTVTQSATEETGPLPNAQRRYRWFRKKDFHGKAIYIF